MKKNIFDKKELIEAATEGTYFNPESTSLVLDIVLEDALTKALREHGEVRIHQFGTFVRVLVPEREHRVPGTDKKIVKPAHWKIKFRPAKKIREAIQ